ncbi:MAG: ferredoxin family protein [Deltaproteobacteria bacterium]|nr:ferredoxin family protein [Deltaproteobacteria bacterium]
MPPIIDSSECTACGRCVEICAEDVFYGSKKGEIPIVTYPRECVHCSCCVYECPVGAIRVRIPLPAMTVYKPTQEKSQ